jgi:hypothetical protein
MLLTFFEDFYRYEVDFLPSYMVYAIDSILAGRSAETRWIKRNYNLKTLRAMASAERFPDFAKVIESASMSDRDPGRSERECLEELCFAVAERNKSRLFTMASLRAMVEKEAPAASGAAANQEAIKQVACKLAWNVNNPAPPEVIERRMNQAVEVTFSAADGSGREEKCHVSRLGGLIKNHPDREKILQSAAKTIYLVGDNASPPLRAAADNVVRAVQTIERRSYPKYDSATESALSAFSRAVAKEKRILELLEKISEENSTLAGTFRHRLEALDEVAPAADSETLKVLEKHSRQ